MLLRDRTDDGSVVIIFPARLRLVRCSNVERSIGHDISLRVWERGVRIRDFRYCIWSVSGLGSRDLGVGLWIRLSVLGVIV